MELLYAQENQPLPPQKKDLLYCSGLELNLRDQRGLPVCVPLLQLHLLHVSKSGPCGIWGPGRF